MAVGISGQGLIPVRALPSTCYEEIKADIFPLGTEINELN
jgi:hypothetical protein